MITFWNTYNIYNLGIPESDTIPSPNIPSLVNLDYFDCEWQKLKSNQLKEKKELSLAAVIEIPRFCFWNG